MNLFALSGLLTGLTCLTMSIYVFLKRHLNPGNKHWSMLCLSVAIWGFGGFFIGLARDPDMALIFWKVSYIGVTFIPAFYYNFVHMFLGMKKGFRLYLSFALSGLFLIASPTMLMIQSVEKQFGEFYYLSSPGILYSLFVLYFVIIVTISHIDLWKFMKVTKDRHKQMQVKWFFLASIVGFTGGTSCFPLVFGIKLYPYGNFCVAAYPIIMSYAIIKHQLLDIRIIIRKTLFYSFLVFLISILNIMIVFAIHKILIGQWNPQIYVNKELDNAQILSGLITKNRFAFTSFLCGVSSLGLAVFAIAIGKTKAQRLFGIFNITVAMWGFGSFLAGIAETPEKAILGWRLAYFGGFFISSIFYHIIDSLFEINNRKFLAVSYTHSFILATLMILSPQRLIQSTRPVNGIYYNALTPFTAAGISMYFLIIGKTFKELLTNFKYLKGYKATQAKYIIFGFAIGFIGGGTTLLPVFGIDFAYSVGHLGITVYVFILLYAMFRHQALDMQIIVKRTVFYSLLVLLISVGYVFLIFILHRLFLLENFMRPTLFNSLIIIVFIMLILKPLEIFLHKILDRKFFKGTITQIAEQKALLEAELERRERLKSVGILAAGMAHEIKNPVTALKTFAEYLPQRYEEPGFRETLARVMKNEAERIEMLVKNLLAFSKPSEPVRVSCDLGETIQGITDLMSGEMTKSKVSLSLDLRHQGARCLVDLEQLKQAILNIVLNAIEAMRPRGGELTISTRVESGTLEIEVRDSGCGIEASKLPHIFDPFYTDKADGTGLGLATTYAIVQRNGGKIRVESKVEVGTQFMLEFPIDRASHNI